MDKQQERLIKDLVVSYNIIFLDIDGVILPKGYKEFDENEAVQFQQKMIHSKNQRYEEVVTRDLYIVKNYFSLDAVKYLKKLCEENNSRIVISSSWRISYLLSDLKLLFQLHELDSYIIGETPDIAAKMRYKEIQAYLKQFDYNLNQSNNQNIVNNNGTQKQFQINNFAILDDNYSQQFNEYFKDNFIQCDPQKCFDECGYQTCLKIFNEKNEN